MQPVQYTSRDTLTEALSDHVKLSQPAGLSVRVGKAAWSDIPTCQLWMSDFGGRTGVTVVSSHPQSTTRPVMRPQAANASRLVGVNETEGTWYQLKTFPRHHERPGLTLRLSKRAWAIASLTYVGMNVPSKIITLRDLASVIKCLNYQLAQIV
jgi:hypothetical protein